MGLETRSASQLLTSWLLQIDKSATLPQFTETTSKQRSGSQPYTRKESWQPAYKQQPSGLNSTHLAGRDGKEAQSRVARPLFSTTAAPAASAARASRREEVGSHRDTHEAAPACSEIQALPGLSGRRGEGGLGQGGEGGEVTHSQGGRPR